YGDATIESARRIPGDAARPFTPVAPDNAAGAGVERPAFVRGRHVHHTVHDQGRVFNGGDAGHGEHPAGREARDIGFIDLRELAVAIAAVVAVVCRPIGLRSDQAVAIAV